MWIIGIMIVFTLSYAIKESPLFRIVEFFVLGIASGILVINTYKNLLGLVWVKGIVEGEYWLVLAFIFSLLLFTRFFGVNIRWLNRWPLSLYVGNYMGIALRASITHNFALITGTLLLGKKLTTDVNALIFWIATMTVISYFIFTRKHTGALGITSKIGRYFIMVSFGALWGGTLYERLALLSASLKAIVWNLLGFG